MTKEKQDKGNDAMSTYGKLRHICVIVSKSLLVTNAVQVS